MQRDDDHNQDDDFDPFKIFKLVYQLSTLRPGEAADFMFYRIYFLDLKEGGELDEDIYYDMMDPEACYRVNSSFNYVSSIDPMYIKQSIDKYSKWILIAVDPNYHIGAFALAEQDPKDKQGIKVTATCNNPRTTVKRKATPNDIEEIKSLSVEKTIDMLKLYNETTDWSKYAGYPILTEKLIGYVKSTDTILRHAGFRTAQLLKIILYSYLTTLNYRHAYNEAITPKVAAFHSRNDMTLRFANCDEPDSIAEEFRSLPFNEREEFIHFLENQREGYGKNGYPMKLCNIDIDLMIYNFARHTEQIMRDLFAHGYTLDMIYNSGVDNMHQRPKGAPRPSSRGASAAASRAVRPVPRRLAAAAAAPKKKVKKAKRPALPKRKPVELDSRELDAVRALKKIRYS